MENRGIVSRDFQNFGPLRLKSAYIWQQRWSQNWTRRKCAGVPAMFFELYKCYTIRIFKFVGSNRSISNPNSCLKTTLVFLAGWKWLAGFSTSVINFRKFWSLRQAEFNWSMQNKTSKFGFLQNYFIYWVAIFRFCAFFWPPLYRTVWHPPLKHPEFQERTAFLKLLVYELVLCIDLTISICS